MFITMWSQYDEDLSQNEFFKEIKRNHSDILRKSSEEHWIICVPRNGSLKNEDISVKVILDHVLVANSENHFDTLSKKRVGLDKNRLKLDKNHSFQSEEIEILFEETHYIEEKSKYTVWCINYPLFYYSKEICHTTKDVSLHTIQDCIDFLYAETFGYNILDGVRNLCVNFWKSHENCFETETMQNQKDCLGNLYSQCLQLCFINDIVKDKSSKSLIYLNNFKVAIETYMQYCLSKKLLYGINTLKHLNDSQLNKTIRNSSDIGLSDLNIPKELSELVVDAKCELSRLNNFVTILDKVHCLSRTFNVFNNKSLNNNNCNQKFYITSENFLQILIYLILQSNIPNWAANLTYLKEYQFSSLSNANFLLASLEAAIAFIQSTCFFDIKRYALKCNNETQDSIFDQIYFKFKEKRDIDDLNDSLRNISHPELCHPLCTCLKCKHLHAQANGKDIYNTVNSLGQNFLFIASMRGDCNFLEYLLSLNFDINSRDVYGKTALHYSAEKGFQDILLLLINSGANVNVSDNDRNTCLHLACDRGHENCVKALLYSSHFIEINLQNLSGDTALFLATKWGYFDIIKILLDNGASVCIKNNRNVGIYKLSPNFYISKLFREFGKEKSSKLLEEVKNDPSFAEAVAVAEDFCPTIIREHGMVFGISARNANESKKIDLLLKAIETNDMPMTWFYLGYNNNNSAPSRASNKCHPLCSCSECSKQIDFYDNSPINMNKFNINMSNKEGLTALHVAAKYGRTEILRVLLDNGALLNVRTSKTYYTPLHLAVLHQRLQTAKELLLCRNCNIDLQDFKGNTALYYACISNSNNLKIVELLLKNGADFHKRNLENKTVLQICEERNLFRVCRMLRELVGASNGESSSRDVCFEDFDIL